MGIFGHGVKTAGEIGRRPYFRSGRLQTRAARFAVTASSGDIEVHVGIVHSLVSLLNKRTANAILPAYPISSAGPRDRSTSQAEVATCTGHTGERHEASANIKRNRRARLRDSAGEINGFFNGPSHLNSMDNAP